MRGLQTSDVSVLDCEEVWDGETSVIWLMSSVALTVGLSANRWAMHFVVRLLSQV